MLKRANVPDNDIQSLKPENNVYHCKPIFYFMTRIMKKRAFCLREIHTETADQFCGNRTTDQILCFRELDSRIPKLAKSEISRYSPVFKGPIWKSQ